MVTNRRKFTAGLAALSASITAIKHTAASQGATQWPIAIFEKVFEGLDFTELATAVNETGADGIEATIRPGGHISPKNAADEVPRMAEALAKHGKRIVIAATGVKSVDQPETRSFLETLVNSGITHYRMSHYHYDLAQPMMPQLRRYAAQAKELAALNAELGIQGLYQNHSGNGRNLKRGYLGALGWDAAMMLEGINPDHLGLAFDTRHLRKDTGSSWPVAVAACRPHVRSIYVKDGIWSGERGDEYEDVPLDTGFVNKGIFSAMRDGLKPMPLCIHMEWLGYRVFPKDEIPDAVRAHQRDIATLQSWL
ncbi:MAG: sugar phosphate isomerase/epimerase [Aureliella sp.]